MNLLYTQSLMAVLILVVSTIGLFFAISWLGRRGREIYFWLGATGLTGGAGCLCLLFRGYASPLITIWAAQVLLLSANGMMWAAVRAFERRRHPWSAIVGGAALWTLACLIPFFFESFVVRDDRDLLRRHRF
jgi:hypothetical protein